MQGQLFHAFEIDLNGMDVVDLGLYRTEEDAMLGIAQFILTAISRDNVDHFLSGEIDLPWGPPSDHEMETAELDWEAALSWLSEHSAAELVDWYRRNHMDLELFVIARNFHEDTPKLDKQTILALSDDHFPFDSLYFKRGENLLPRL